jgi:hypothetical protein
MTQPLGGCPGCGGEESFEQVHPGRQADDRCPAVSGPDLSAECPEWVCPACGAGVFMSPVMMSPVMMNPALMNTVITGTPAAPAASAAARQSVRAA